MKDEMRWRDEGWRVKDERWKLQDPRNRKPKIKWAESKVTANGANKIWHVRTRKRTNNTEQSNGRNEKGDLNLNKNEKGKTKHPKVLHDSVQQRVFPARSAGVWATTGAAWSSTATRPNSDVRITFTTGLAYWFASALRSAKAAESG